MLLQMEDIIVFLLQELIDYRMECIWIWNKQKV